MAIKLCQAVTVSDNNPQDKKIKSMLKYIAQQDEICEECGCDIPKGDIFYAADHDDTDYILCQDCYSEEDNLDL